MSLFMTSYLLLAVLCGKGDKYGFFACIIIMMIGIDWDVARDDSAPSSG